MHKIFLKLHKKHLINLKNTLTVNTAEIGAIKLEDHWPGYIYRKIKLAYQDSDQ